MKHLHKIFFVIITITLFNTCNTTEPPTDELKPGRRDYVWTIDTIDTPNAPLGKMWGSSPNSIWRTSDGSWDESISYYNGYSWLSYGISAIVTPFAIYGFAKNSVFIGGAGNGRIWKYNGNSWTQYAQLTKDGHADIVVEEIWGLEENNFYAVGGYGDTDGTFNKSVISHFNNGNWNMFDTEAIKGIVERIYENVIDNKIYVCLIKIGDATTLDSTIIYEYNQQKYHKLYSNVWAKGLQADISLINSDVIFVMGSQIAKRVNNQFQTILYVNNPNFYQRIWGRNSKDIFLLMTDGLSHYNGTDVEYLFHFTLGEVKPWTQIYSALLFEKDVFFLVYEPTTHLNLVYHGKLN